MKILLYFMILFVFIMNLNAIPVTGLQLWLDAGDSSTILEDTNGNVYQWTDKSGNGNNAVQGTAAERPTLNATAFNGEAAIRFDGVNDGMLISNLNVTGDYTMFIVNKYYGTPGGRTLQSTDINWLLGLWSGYHGHYAEGWIFNESAGNNAWISEAIRKSSSPYSTYYSNGDYRWANDSIGSPGHLALVGEGRYSNEQSQSDVAEIIIYDRVLTDNERNIVGSYLADKYNMSTSYVTPVAEPSSLVLLGIMSVFCFILKRK